MILEFDEIEIYIKPGVTDMRKQINGLSILVQDEMNLDLFSSSIFLFSNKQRKLLKVLYWDKNGFCLWQKRLEKDKFPWPQDENQAYQINFEQLKLLLSGIDFFKAHKELKYSKIN